MNSMKILIIVNLVFGVAFGGYVAYFFAVVDRSEYQKTADFQIELLEKRIATVESEISGGVFKSQLLAETDPEKKAALEGRKVQKSAVKKRLLQKKEKIRQLKQESKPSETASNTFLAKFLEKREKVKSYKKAADFWIDQFAKLPQTDLFDITVEGGEISSAQKAQIALGSQLLPSDFPKNVKLIVSYMNPDMRNGMAGKGILILKGQNPDLFFQTFIHEAGHVYSLRGDASGTPSPFFDFQRNLPESDPSVPYFALSWLDNEKSWNDAFPSIYGTTDPFEDYAESFIFYIMQGKAFRQAGKTDEGLRKKYDFMKQTFAGKEFDSFEDFKNRLFAIQEFAFDPDQFFTENP